MSSKISKDAINISPTPGFVVKVRIANQGINKLFVNICSHDTIPAGPASLKLLKKWPLAALGDMRQTVDNAGEIALVVDAIVSPLVLAEISARDAASELKNQVGLTRVLMPGRYDFL